MLKTKMQYAQNKTKFLFCFAGLLIMFAVEAWFGITVNEYLHTAWIALFAVILPYEGVLYLITALFPFCSLLTHFAHAFLVLFLILLLKRVVLRRDGAKKVFVFALIAFFACAELITHFLYGVSVFNKVLGYVFTIAIFFWLLYENEHGNYRMHLRIYVFAVFAFCVITFVNAIISHPGNWFADFLDGGLRLGGTAASEFEETDVKINANALAYYTVSAIACLLCIFGKGENENLSVKIFEIVELVFITVVGMLTVSRSWLLVFVMIICLFFVSRARANKSANKTIALFLGILILSVALINSSFMDAFMQRFAGESIETAGGRTEIMEDYFKIFFSRSDYMLFGTGVSDYSEVVHMSLSMHNGTQQIIVCLGIPAAIVFLVAMLRPIFRAKKGKRIPLQYWLPFISVILFVQTIQFLNPNTLMLPYVISLYAIKTQEE